MPISLSKKRLRSNLEFTCGGSHVVKMHKYQEMKKQSGTGLLNALANDDWFTEGMDLDSGWRGGEGVGGYRRGCFCAEEEEEETI